MTLKLTMLPAILITCSLAGFANAQSTLEIATLEQELSAGDHGLGLSHKSSDPEAMKPSEKSAASEWLAHELAVTDGDDGLYEGMRPDTKAVSTISLDPEINSLLGMSEDDDGGAGEGEE